MSTRKAIGWLICSISSFDMYFGLVNGDFLKVQVGVMWLFIAWMFDDLWE